MSMERDTCRARAGVSRGGSLVIGRGAGYSACTTTLSLLSRPQLWPTTLFPFLRSNGQQRVIVILPYASRGYGRLWLSHSPRGLLCHQRLERGCHHTAHHRPQDRPFL